jgi:thioredoxin reductase
MEAALKCMFDIFYVDAFVVQVDDYQNTTAKGVYAIGDVAGNVQLTPGSPMALHSIFPGSGTSPDLTDYMHSGNCFWTKTCSSALR